MIELALYNNENLAWLTLYIIVMVCVCLWAWALYDKNCVDTNKIEGIYISFRYQEFIEACKYAIILSVSRTIALNIMGTPYRYNGNESAIIAGEIVRFYWHHENR